MRAPATLASARSGQPASATAYADFAAYGWPAGISDEDILKNLLNLERSGSAAVS